MQMRGECGDDEMTEMDERVGVAVTICSGPMNGKEKKRCGREKGKMIIYSQRKPIAVRVRCRVQSINMNERRACGM